MISIACSGPNSTAKIMTNIAIGQHGAFMVLGVLACMLLLSIKRKEFNRLLWIPMILLIIHPVWTISATKGDCGILKKEVSNLFTFLALAVLSWQILSYIYFEELKPEEKEH